jgi:hypothetical protein
VSGPEPQVSTKTKTNRADGAADETSHSEPESTRVSEMLAVSVDGSIANDADEIENGVYEETAGRSDDCPRMRIRVDEAQDEKYAGGGGAAEGNRQADDNQDGIVDDGFNLSRIRVPNSPL